MTNQFDIFLILWFAVTLSSFIVYKLKIYNFYSWEDALKFCTIGLIQGFCKSIKSIWDYGTGKTSSKDIIKNNLSLTNQEVIELVKRSSCVYEFPTLIKFNILINYINIEFTAIGLVDKYKECSCNVLREIIKNIVQTYYHEIRGSGIDVFVSVATANRVCIEIPLSESAREYLEKKDTVLSQQDNAPYYDTLEEEIECTNELEG